MDSFIDIKEEVDSVYGAISFAIDTIKMLHCYITSLNEGDIILEHIWVSEKWVNSLGLSRNE